MSIEVRSWEKIYSESRQRRWILSLVLEIPSAKTMPRKKTIT